MPQLPTDDTIIERAQEGEEDSFRILYYRHFPRVFSLVRTRFRNEEDARDATQVTFMHAFSALREFRRDAAFSTWLTRIALNVCHSQMKAAILERERVQSVEEEELVAPEGVQSSFYDDPEESTYKAERRKILHNAIEALPLHYRDALWLRYARDRTYIEIFEELKVPIGTVKTWICRGKRLLETNVIGE